MQSVFVHFKASSQVRPQTLSAINSLGSTIAANTGASFTCGRRADQATHDSAQAARDTWLEHYRCADESTTLAVLASLNQLDPAQPLVALIDGGIEGRHLEHFIDTPRCA